MQKTATEIRKLEGSWRGDARLYKLSEPLDGHEYVIASAVSLDFAFSILDYSCEVMIFPADANGVRQSWSELGVKRGTLSHYEAFETLGYQTK